jgi:hypothetical protein
MEPKWIAVLGVAALLTVTWDSAVAIAMRSALDGGWRAGFRATLGIKLGRLVSALATSLGVAAGVASSEPAFTTLKLVGAGYPIFLGALTLRCGPSRLSESAGTMSRPLRRGLLADCSTRRSASSTRRCWRSSSCPKTRSWRSRSAWRSFTTRPSSSGWPRRRAWSRRSAVPPVPPRAPGARSRRGRRSDALDVRIAIERR